MTTHLPLAGLVGAPADVQATAEHKNQTEALGRDKMLNDNVQD